MSKPSPDLLIELAWRTEAPTWTRDLQYRLGSQWHNICLRALRWQAEGLSEEQMRAEYAQALAATEELHRDFARRLNERPAGAKQHLTASLLEEL